MYRTIGKKLGLFSFIGAGVAVIGLALQYLLVEYFYWNASVANVAQLTVTFWLNYKFSKLFTWNGYEGRGAMQRFVLTRSATSLLSLVVYLVADDYVSYLEANLAGVLVGSAANFIITNNWVFNPVGKVYTLDNADELRLGKRTLYGVACVLTLTATLMYIGLRDMFGPVVLTLLSMTTWAMAGFYLLTLVWPKRHQHATEALRPGELRHHYVNKIGVLMPARKEPTDYAITLLNAAFTQRFHPDHRFFSVTYAHDPDTTRIAMVANWVIQIWVDGGRMLSYAELKALLLSELETVLLDGSPLSEQERAYVQDGQRKDFLHQIYIYTLQAGDIPSKPLKLNYVRQLKRGEFHIWTILDAESLAAPNLLCHMDQERQDHPDVDVFQFPVQLIDPDFSGNFRQQAEQRTQRWYYWPNVLEYYRCFPGQMPVQAAVGFTPWAGNSLGITDELLEAIGDWPLTMTEDAAGGMKASALGFKTLAFYDPKLATREQTPTNFTDWRKQRERWDQGFLQSLLSGEWRAAPTTAQRMLGLWVLSSPFLQSLAALLVPVTAVTMFLVDSPPVLVLLMYAPMATMVVALILQLMQLRQYGREFHRKVAWYDYLINVAVFYPYQIALGIAAFGAVMRQINGKFDWHTPQRDAVSKQTPTVRPASEPVSAAA
jgi:cellulose synthase/poly-beta-1,6-N-acetylglucosamine synthase-like glycosyltransferase/putative flippase GtrA